MDISEEVYKSKYELKSWDDWDLPTDISDEDLEYERAQFIRTMTTSTVDSVAEEQIKVRPVKSGKRSSKSDRSRDRDSKLITYSSTSMDKSSSKKIPAPIRSRTSSGVDVEVYNRLPPEHMLLFGSYPENEVFSISTCPICNRIFKTEWYLAHYELNHGQILTPEASEDETAAVETPAAVEVVKPKKKTNHNLSIPHEDHSTSTSSSRRTNISSSVQANLVKVKLESATTSENGSLSISKSPKEESSHHTHAHAHTHTHHHHHHSSSSSKVLKEGLKSSSSSSRPSSAPSIRPKSVSKLMSSSSLSSSSVQLNKNKTTLAPPSPLGDHLIPVLKIPEQSGDDMMVKVMGEDTDTVLNSSGLLIKELPKLLITKSGKELKSTITTSTTSSASRTSNSLSSGLVKDFDSVKVKSESMENRNSSNNNLNNNNKHREVQLQIKEKTSSSSTTTTISSKSLLEQQLDLKASSIVDVLKKEIEMNRAHKPPAKKRISQVEPQRKVVPLKDRLFDPNVHCGVCVNDGPPCKRSLTCKTHSVATRRAVQGRIQSFDVLLATHKKRREEEAKMQAEAKNLQLLGKSTSLITLLPPRSPVISAMASKLAAISHKPAIITSKSTIPTTKSTIPTKSTTIPAKSTTSSKSITPAAKPTIPTKSLIGSGGIGPPTSTSLGGTILPTPPGSGITITIYGPTPGESPSPNNDNFVSRSNIVPQLKPISTASISKPISTSSILKPPTTRILSTSTLSSPSSLTTTTTSTTSSSLSSITTSSTTSSELLGNLLKSPIVPEVHQSSIIHHKPLVPLRGSNTNVVSSGYKPQPTTIPLPMNLNPIPATSKTSAFLQQIRRMDQGIPDNKEPLCEFEPKEGQLQSNDFVYDSSSSRTANLNKINKKATLKASKEMRDKVIEVLQLKNVAEMDSDKLEQKIHEVIGGRGRGGKCSTGIIDLDSDCKMTSNNNKVKKSSNDPQDFLDQLKETNEIEYFQLIHDPKLAESSELLAFPPSLFGENPLKTNIIDSYMKKNKNTRAFCPIFIPGTVDLEESNNDDPKLSKVKQQQSDRNNNKHKILKFKNLDPNDIPGEILRKKASMKVERDSKHIEHQILKAQSIAATSTIINQRKRKYNNGVNTTTRSNKNFKIKINMLPSSVHQQQMQMQILNSGIGIRSNDSNVENELIKEINNRRRVVGVGGIESNDTSGQDDFDLFKGPVLNDQDLNNLLDVQFLGD